MDAFLGLPDTEYGTDIRTREAIVRPLLVKGKAGIGVMAFRGKQILTEMSPEDARRLGLDMIEVANRADAARAHAQRASAPADI